jgi:ATP-dependent Lhr-like helicase
LTPFAFPIWAERIRTQVSSEDWSARMERMALELARVADRDGRRRPRK